MKKCDVDTHRDWNSRHSLPAINVKVYHFGTSAYEVAEKFGCNEEDAQKALDLTFDSHQQQFWDGVQDTAEHYLGKGIKVYSEGRSGGWLVVEGLPEIEEWDAIQLGKWARFEKSIRQEVDYLTSAESIHETIEANQYFKHGSEQYNLLDRDGETLCVADLKREAIEAGYGPVVRP